METVPITEFAVDNPEKRDWVGILIIAVMLVGAVMVCYYLVTQKITTCTKDPIKYAFENAAIGNDIYNESDFSTRKFNHIIFQVYENEDDLVPIYVKKIESNS